MKKLLILLVLFAAIAVHAKEERISLPRSTADRIFAYLRSRPYQESAKLIHEIQKTVRAVKPVVKVKPAKIKPAVKAKPKKKKVKAIKKQAIKKKQ